MRLSNTGMGIDRFGRRIPLSFWSQPDESLRARAPAGRTAHRWRPSLRPPLGQVTVGANGGRPSACRHQPPTDGPSAMTVTEPAASKAAHAPNQFLGLEDRRLAYRRAGSGRRSCRAIASGHARRMRWDDPHPGMVSTTQQPLATTPGVPGRHLDEDQRQPPELCTVISNRLQGLRSSSSFTVTPRWTRCSQVA